MPRKDPVTGVNVMTTGEFMAKMAEQNGTTPAQEWEETFRVMEEALQEDTQNIRDNALSILQEQVEIENRYNERERRECEKKGLKVERGEYAFIEPPTELIEILDLDYSAGFSGDNLRLSAHCRRADGTEGTITYTREYWAGTRLDPPDGDEAVGWEEG